MTFDVFDVHHHVGRAFDALGGELDPRRPTDAEEFAASSSPIGCGSWTRAACARRSVDPRARLPAAERASPTPAWSTTRSPRTATARPTASRWRAASSNPRRCRRVRRDRPRRRRARPGRAQLPHPVPGRLAGQPLDRSLPRADGRARARAGDPRDGRHPGGGALEAGLDRTGAPRPHHPRARRVRRLRGHAAVLLRRRRRAQHRLRHQPQLQLRLHRGLRPPLRCRARRCSAPTSTRTRSGGASATCSPRSRPRALADAEKAAILGGTAATCSRPRVPSAAP